MEHEVLLIDDISDAGKQHLINSGYNIIELDGTEEKEIIERIADSSAVMVRTTNISRSIINAGKKLKVISRQGIGVDNIDIIAATEAGIYVTNAPISNYHSVAEHALGFILALGKNMIRLDTNVRGGNYEIRNNLIGVELKDKVLGIIGLGLIGSELARKASYGLSMNIIGYDPFADKSKLPKTIELVSDLHELIRRADFVSLHVPLNVKTKGLIGYEEIKTMKQSAYLINVSRGGIIHEPALIDALRRKRIAGAALDVFEKEPIKKDDDLLKFENVIVTPHNAALTSEAIDRMGLHSAMGIDDVLSGRTPKWSINTPKFINT